MTWIQNKHRQQCILSSSADINSEIKLLISDRLAKAHNLVSFIQNFFGDNFHFNIIQTSEGFDIEYNQTEQYSFTATEYPDSPGFSIRHKSNMGYDSSVDGKAIECVESDDTFIFKSILVFNHICDVYFLFNRHYNLDKVKISNFMSKNPSDYQEFSMIFGHGMKLEKLIERRGTVSHNDSKFKAITTQLLLYRISQYANNPDIQMLLPEYFTTGVYDFTSDDFKQRLLTFNMYLF